MPRIVYTCKKCKETTKKFFSKVSSVKESIECKHCKGEAERSLSAPSSKSTMTVDNGFQARETEIIHDIVEMNKERSDKGYNRGD